MIRVVLAVAFVLCVHARPTRACSCAGPDPVPARGAADVPFNIRELLLPAYGHLELRRMDSDAIVPTTLLQQRVGGATLIRVDAELSPATAYYTLGADVRFTTGTERDDVPPGPVTIDELAIERLDPERTNSTCAPAQLHTTSSLTLPVDAALLGVRFTGEGRVQEFRFAASPYALTEIRNATCSVYAELDAGERHQVEIWAQDIAGNVGPVTTTFVDVTGGCGCASSSPGSSVLLLLVFVAMARPRAARRFALSHPRRSHR